MCKEYDSSKTKYVKDIPRLKKLQSEGNEKIQITAKLYSDISLPTPVGSSIATHRR